MKKLSVGSTWSLNRDCSRQPLGSNKFNLKRIHGGSIKKKITWCVFIFLLQFCFSSLSLELCSFILIAEETTLYYTFFWFRTFWLIRWLDGRAHWKPSQNPWASQGSRQRPILYARLIRVWWKTIHSQSKLPEASQLIFCLCYQPWIDLICFYLLCFYSRNWSQLPQPRWTERTTGCTTARLPLSEPLWHLVKACRHIKQIYTLILSKR